MPIQHKESFRYRGAIRSYTIANQFIKDHKILSANSITFITGPESGFSGAERHIIKELGLPSLKIGHYVLRAETAPVIGLSVFHGLFGEY